MLIIGCGYLGRALGAQYLMAGAPVTGVVSTPESAGILEKIGISPVVRDLDLESEPMDPSAHPEIFYFAPPSDNLLQDNRIRTFLGQLTEEGAPPRIVYTSTTGIYGDCQGNWVEESRPPSPATDRARRRLDAEQALSEWSRTSGGKVVILRVSGIYGPGRLPLARLRQGMALLEEAEAPPSNRIHIRDLVTTCAAAMERGKAGEIYNVSDGNPSPMNEYFNLVADLAGLERPRTLDWTRAERELPPGLLSFLKESRRIDNRKMLQELGIELRFPTFEEGVRASF